MTETKTKDTLTEGLLAEPADGPRGIATREQHRSDVATVSDAEFNATSMLAMVERLALDDRVDAGKLETVMRVANQQQDREQEKEFYRDKNRAVRAMPVIRKDGKIVIANKQDPNNRALDRVQGHFEKWTDVQRAITPVLDANKMTLTHRIGHTESKTIVIAVLTHDNGFREESGEMGLPLDTSGGKNNVQGAGSSQTYGMRYTTRAICGLRFEGGQDDDGLGIALPDEPLNDQQARRVVEAEAAWAQSEEVFEEWWSKVSPMDRAWMIQTNRYSEITGRDGLPGTKPRLSAPDQAQKPDTAANDWTVQYEADLQAAESLDDMAVIQQRGKKAMDKLKASGMTDLYERCVTAGSEAYARLSDQGEE